MNYAEYRRKRLEEAERRSRTARRPTLTSQEERFLYGMRMKTMEHRTLLLTLKQVLPSEILDEVIVEYNLRLGKAKRNFEHNNFKPDWYLEEEE